MAVYEPGFISEQEGRLRSSLVEEFRRISHAFSILEGGRNTATRDVVESTDVLATDKTLFIDASGGNIVVTHINAPRQKGKDFYFERIDSSTNTVSVDGSGPDLIEDVASFPLYPGESLTTVSDGTDWRVV